MIELRHKTTKWLQSKMLEHISSEVQEGGFHLTWYVMDLAFKKMLTIKNIPVEINRVSHTIQLNILLPLVREQLESLVFDVEDFHIDSIYYSREASLKFWSCSSFKRMMRCEANAVAWLYDEIPDPEDTTAFSEGKLLHMAVLEPHMFRKENTPYLKKLMPEIFKKNGRTGFYAKYDKIIEEVGDVIRDMPLIQDWIRDPNIEFEVPYTFELAGVQWKSKLDVVGPDFIADLKFMKAGAFDKEDWYLDYGYDFQAFLYSQGFIQQNLIEPKYGLIGIEKRKHGAISSKWIHNSIDPERHLKLVEEKMPRFEALKKREIEPTACGKCHYCRQTYKLTGIE